MSVDHQRAPKLLVLAGVSGTGKTETAYAVSRSVGSPVVLEIDIVKQVLDESGLPTVHRFHVDTPTDPATMGRAYGSLQERVSFFLRRGFHVIAVATHRSAIAQQRIAAVAEEEGAEFHPYVLTGSREALEARVLKRPDGHMSGINDPAEIQRMLEGFNDFPGATQIDTSVLSREQTVRKIVTEVWGPQHYRPERLSEVARDVIRGFQRLRSGLFLR